MASGVTYGTSNNSGVVRYTRQETTEVKSGWVLCCFLLFGFVGIGAIAYIISIVDVESDDTSKMSMLANIFFNVDNAE